MRRIALTALMALCCIQHASACIGPAYERSMFFDESDLRLGVDAPVIVDVTVKSITPVVSTYSLIVSARIHRIIKGTIGGGDEIKIAFTPSSCDRGLGEGIRGIVAGTLTRDPDGTAVIRPFFESNGNRSLRQRGLQVPPLRP